MNRRLNQREFCRRGGFSLIEMLVVITLSTLVLGVVISLMFSLRQWDRRFRGRAVECDRLIALADVLRTDIRRASEVRAPAEGQLMITSAAGQQQRYDLGPLGCTRTVETTDAADRRTELFAIGPATRWNVERDVSGRGALVKVTLDRGHADAQAQTPRRVPLLVYGALGADLGIAPSSE